MQWGEVYAAMAKENLTVVGGADHDVGIGGWTLGAGHGPLSSLYGLGADNVLAMDIVDANGTIRMLDEDSTGEEKELFWAMKGVCSPNSTTLLKPKYSL
jgi:FAD/FMN-containing dehydrogenase